MRGVRFAMGSQGVRPRLRILGVVILAALIGLAALFGLLKPIKNGCTMTYMYPTYIPISVTDGATPPGRYGLYLYHEGWRKIDFKAHLDKLSGVPVLFIPGNAGSFKQILDQYKESHDTREREGAAASSNIPHNVILVGHSMGGVVARAATVHPRLRKSAVQTSNTIKSTPITSSGIAAVLGTLLC